MYPSRIRLSTSTIELFHTCERKFQLVELLKGNTERSDSAIFSFGSGWGAGIVEYLLTGSLDAAIYKAWLTYWPQMEDDSRREEYCFHGLRKAQPHLDTIRKDWEIAEFNGRPAIELGFQLDINERFYFQSAIDGVLHNKNDNGYAVLENKHTYSWLEDITPMYKNSGQALGYSIIVDKIANQMLGRYNLHYLIGQFNAKNPIEPKIHFYPWKKTLLDRLNWFMTLGIDVQRMQTLLDANVFPMRGHSCLRFNRPCTFFNFCQMRKGDEPKDDAYIEANKSEHVKEIESLIQFRFNLSDILKEHLDYVKQEAITP